MKTKQQAKSANLNINPKQKKRFKMLSAFSILLLIIAILIFVSWILKWTGITTTIVVDQFFSYNNGSWIPIDTLPENTNSFQQVTANWWTNNQSNLNQDMFYLVTGFNKIAPINALGILDLFVAPTKGFLDKAGIIIFVMLVGSFVFMVIASKALEASGQAIIAKLKGKEIWAIIPLMTFCSLGGTSFGFAEETFGFYLILIPIMLAAGFDTMTGLLIVMLGAGIGVIGSTVNPFMITISADALNEGVENIATPMSAGDGLVWRIISWFLLTASAIIFVMWYANRVKKNPTKSVTFSTLKEDKTFFLTNTGEKIEMTGRRKATLVVFGLVFLFMILYLINWDSLFGVTFMKDMADSIHQYFPYFDFTIPGFGIGDVEFVASFFLLGSIIVGLINTVKVKKPVGQTSEDFIIRDFVAGAMDVLSVCLVIATASGIGIILVQSHMQELIVNALSNSLGGINSEIGKILVLFILFIPLSFLIPSSSGFATAVFPLLTGVVSVTNGQGVTIFDPVSASGSITAFSFAEGIVNLITPTSGVVMGGLALSRISYGKYIKVVLPFIGFLIVFSIILLSIGGAIGGNIA